MGAARRHSRELVSLHSCCATRARVASSPIVELACRMMLTKIAKDKCLPFGTEKPNAETPQAMEDVEYGRDLHRAKDANSIFTDLSI